MSKTSDNAARIDELSKRVEKLEKKQRRDTHPTMARTGQAKGAGFRRSDGAG